MQTGKMWGLVLIHQPSPAWCTPIGATGQLAFREIQTGGCKSQGHIILQRAIATAEKAPLLNATSWNSLTDGVCSMPCKLGWLGRANPLSVTVAQIDWPIPWRSLKVITNILNCNSEANQLPVQLVKQQCNMCHPRDPKNCLHNHILHQLGYERMTGPKSHSQPLRQD